MKKTMTLIFAMMAAAVSSHAQGYNAPGYRGMADAGYTIGVGDYDFGRFEVNTVHGYQANPFFFVGAGLGLHFMPSYTYPETGIPLDQRESMVDIPFFADLKCNFTSTRFSPFIDVRGGTFLTNGGGLYVNAAAGFQYAVNKRQAVYFSVGYTMEKLEFESFDSFKHHTGMDYYTAPRKLDTEAVALKLGFAF